LPRILLMDDPRGTTLPPGVCSLMGSEGAAEAEIG